MTQQNVELPLQQKERTGLSLKMYKNPKSMNELTLSPFIPAAPGGPAIPLSPFSPLTPSGPVKPSMPMGPWFPISPG